MLHLSLRSQSAKTREKKRTLQKIAQNRLSSKACLSSSELHQSNIGELHVILAQGPSLGVHVVSEGLLNALRAAVGLDAVSTEATDLLFYTQDSWPRMLILRLGKKTPPWRPDVIVWPRSHDAVREVARICSEAGVPLVPYGGGSGVCGSAVPAQGGVVVDLKRMNRLVEIDDFSMTATVEAGMIGSHLEAALNERGYTLGHFPSSIMCSTVGGWVATRSAGQFSSRYGKIEDIVYCVDCVLPDGSEVSVDLTQSHEGGPDLGRLVLGSEGTLAVVTRVRLKLQPLPAARAFAGFRFVDLKAGLEAMRHIMQHGLRPAVMRLYDPIDTMINRFPSSPEQGGSQAEETHQARLRQFLRPLGRILGQDLSEFLAGRGLRTLLRHPGIFQRALSIAPLTCVLVVGFEGEERRVKENMAMATDLIRRATGKELGPGPGEHWYRHRYSVSFKQSPVFGQGAFVETIEVASLWRDLPRVYAEVRKALIDRALVMAHFSHAYREGCAAYFTVVGYHPNPDKMLSLYDEVVRRTINAAMRAGATLSHHHGVGMMKRNYTAEEWQGGDRLFWAVKEALDPRGIMNPEKVYSPSVPVRVKREAETRTKPEFETIVSWEHRTKGGRAIVPDVPEEIAEVLKLAQESGQCVVCQSGGQPGSVPETRKPMLFLDLSRLDSVLDMDPVSGTVTAQAGMVVYQLENFLHEKGFTLGFVPRSRLLKSLGDLLALANPGEGSPLYGSITDNCIGLSAVIADGTFFKVRPSPRRAAGPDLMHLFIGARGRYGIITAACMRIFPLPTVRESVAYACDDPVLALSAVRTVLARQVRPEWVLLVVRAPSKLDNRRRVRIVFQFGGDRATVTSHLSAVRLVLEPLGMEGEPVRAEERLAPKVSRVRSVERFVPMSEVLECMRRLADVEDWTCPEVHVTDIRTYGATFRLLQREETHVFPEPIVKILSRPYVSPTISEVADRLKQTIDPYDILNPHLSMICQTTDAR